MKKNNKGRNGAVRDSFSPANATKYARKQPYFRLSMLLGLGICALQASAQVSVTSSAGTTGPSSYTTLNSAFNAINAGTHQGVINIAITGNTTEPATPTPLLASGGTASYTAISIKPSGGNFVINSNAAPVTNRGVIELAGADNVTIDGDDPLTPGTRNLSIVAAQVSTSGVACIRLSSNSTSGADGADNNSIKNCIITGSRNSGTTTTNSYGIQFSNGVSTSSSTSGAYSSLNTLIQNNLITRCYYGINAIGTASYPSTGTKILDNVLGSAVSAENIGFRGIIISYSAGTAGASSAVISGNDIRVGNYTTSGYSATIAGIEISSSNPGCLVSRNNIHDISQPSTSGYGAHGIYITTNTANDAIAITNNYIRDCKMVVYQSSLTSTYIPCGVFFTGTATNVVFTHNTVVMSSQLAASTTYSSACVNSSVSGVTFSKFLNNILVNTHASSGAYAFYTAATANISGATVNNNNYYVSSPAKVGYYSGSGATTLSAWQTATGKDAQALNENPPFISATDLHLQQGAYTYLESGGATTAITGITTDYDLQPRPGASTYGYGTAPDIGADEFDGRGTACGTPAPGNTLSTANPICYGASVTFSMSSPPVGPGFSFQWQYSDDNVTYTNIAGANGTTYTVNPDNKYYRCMATCSIGPINVASAPLLIQYANTITNATSNQRCGNGTVDLTATGSTGTTLKWYNAATGGLPIGSGSPFTTPVINTTTSYYVGAESGVNGQVVVGTGTSATGTTSYPNPFSAFYGGTKHQLLFLASELQLQGLAPGNITSIAFDIAAVNTSGTCQDFTIRMGTTTNTSLSDFVTGTTTVYNATYTPSATGIVTFNLSTPYNWDGTSNIIVETVHNAGNSGNGSGTTTRYTTTPFNSVYVRYSDGVTPAGVASFDATTSGTTAAYANRPNVVFGGQKICSSPRVAVTATVNTPPSFSITANQTICNNAITPLMVTSPPGNFNNYIWTPVTGLYTDPAATVPYTAGGNASTVYLKSATPATTTFTVNANNTTTQCAAITNTEITVLPGAIAASASPTSLCGPGTATFSLNPGSGYAAAGFQWQSSADNTTFTDIGSATAATYTAPVINTTTYYRATIKNSAGVVCLHSVSDTAIIHTPSITGTTPAVRCGPGTVTLGATGFDGIVNWFANATGGTPLASGNTFTTPSLAATTTYYAAAVTGAPGNATIGDGASTTVSSTSSADKVSPFDHYYGGFKTQNLITAAELTASGLMPGEINSLAFDVASGGGLFQGFTLSIGTTAATTLSTTPVGSLTAVYTSTAPAGYTTPASGLAVFNFSTPFVWDGTSNIVIQTCYSNNNSGGTGTTVKFDATSFVSHNYYQSDNQTPATICGASSMTNTLSKRPKMVINGIMVCSSTPRTAVAATVNPLPSVTVTPSGTVPVCAGSTTTLTATGGGNYQWRNASGNISGQTGSTFTTGNAGAYKVVVTNPATGCTDSSAATTVTINPLPVVALGNDTAFCSGNSLILNAGNPGADYVWNNNSTNQTRTVNSTGTYWVKVTDGNNCAKTDTIQVTVNPTPVVDLGNDTNLCLGVNYVLDAGNPGATRLWDNGTTDQTRTVTATGTYYVQVTNSFNCMARDTVTTTFLPAPVVNLGYDIEVCQGANVTLNAGNPGETFLWDNGSTQQTRTVNASGNYYVTVSNIADCKGSDTIQVTVHPLPVVNLGNDTIICHGITLTLNAGNPGATYLWNDNSTGQTLNVTATGAYNVVVTDAHSCVNTDAINVLVKQLPGGIINAVHGDPATYTFNILNPQYVTGYTWNFGDGTPPVSGNMVQHTYSQNGIYNVSVKLNGECSDSTLIARTVDVFDALGGGTGISGTEDSKELVLYPNPARDIVVIENKHNLKLKHVVVYNVVGQVVADAKAETSDKHQLNTASFAPGIYTVRIETDKGIAIRKFEIVK